MKPKSKTKTARQRARPTPSAAFAVLVDIRDKLTFLCEAKNRDEVRAERANARTKKLALALMTQAAKAGYFPAPLLAEFQAAFSESGKN